MEVIKGVRIALGRDVSMMIHNFKAGFLNHWKRIVPCRLQNSQTNVIYFHGASIIGGKPVCFTGSAMEGRENILQEWCNWKKYKRTKWRAEWIYSRIRKKRIVLFHTGASLKEAWRMWNFSSFVSFSNTWLVLAYVGGTQIKWKIFCRLKTSVICLNFILSDCRSKFLQREAHWRWMKTGEDQIKLH